MEMAAVKGEVNVVGAGVGNGIRSAVFTLGYYCWCYSSLCVFLLFALAAVPLVQCKGEHEKSHTLDFSYAYLEPDRFLQKGIAINGQFPGQTLRFYTSETYEVQVINNLDHGLAIHFHGILQKGTVESDGVPYVTQYPIPPRASYVYKMHTGNQSGTFMYHAHTGLDLVWAFGALIIEDSWKVEENAHYYYDRECVIFVNQIWHTPITTIAKGIEGKPFQDVPDTDSIFVHSPTCPSENEEKTRYSIIGVRSGLTYRFRVIGMGMDSMLTFSIRDHNFKIIEVDGVLVDPVETDILQLNSAQRYSILVKMDKAPGNYLMESQMMPGPGPKNGIAILHYEGADNPTILAHTTERDEGETEELELSQWVLDKLHPSTKISNSLVYPVPEEIDREIIITSFQRDVDGYTRFDINGVVHKTPQIPLLHQVFNGTDITAFKENGAYEILVGERVQIVFENRVSDEGECEQHPWHTHGHTFYIVAQGADSYNPVEDRKKIDEHVKREKNFLMRDVLTLYPNQTVENNSSGAPCGWIAVRFIADNPGLWLVHCHITPHQMMGKEFILYEHQGNGLQLGSKSVSNTFSFSHGLIATIQVTKLLYEALTFLFSLGLTL